MTGLDAIQWLAGAGLIGFGLDELARHTGGLAQPLISAFSERLRHRPGCQFAIGIPAGMALQGRRGGVYLRRRRIAGLLSRPQAIFTGMGMALGMMLPAIAVFSLPPLLRFPVLMAGVLLTMSSRDSVRPALGRALVGLGCCWIGFVACLESMSAGSALPISVLSTIALAGSLALRTPVPLWLILASTCADDLPGQASIIASAAIAGWGIAIARMMMSMKHPFRQPDSRIDYRVLHVPERALQAVLQEVRRLATGLADAVHRHLSPLLDGDPTGLVAMKDVEQAMDEFKPAAHRFLAHLARYQLDERQARLLLLLYRCVSDLERVGDHVDALADSAIKHPAIKTGSGQAPEGQSALRALTQTTIALIDTVADAITGNTARAEAAARRILERRRETIEILNIAADTLARDMEDKRIQPSVAIHEHELLSHFERIIRHIHAIAQVAQQPEFRMDPDSIPVLGHIHRMGGPPPVPPLPYLERLRNEEGER